MAVTAMAMPNRPARLVGDDDAGDDDDRRQRGRFQRDREALDDVGAVAGDRGLGDRDDRALVGAGVVFGDDDDQQRHDEADQPQMNRFMPEVILALPVPIETEADHQVVAAARPTIDSTPVAIRPL
jgi:hypothetical protein